MREPTEDHIIQQRRLLRELEDEFPRINRPNCNRDLRNSLHTRILEVRAHIEQMEVRMMRKPSGSRRLQVAAAA
jgi:hypothetical protein